MEMRYLYESGKSKRVMHIMRFDNIGNAIFESLCDIKINFNRSINAPFGLGRKICRNCLRRMK